MWGLQVVEPPFLFDVAFASKVVRDTPLNKLAGSSLDQKPKSELSEVVEKSEMEKVLDKPLKMEGEETEYKLPLSQVEGQDQLGTCKMHGIEPFGWLKDVLLYIPEHPVNKVQDLLPHH